MSIGQLYVLVAGLAFLAIFITGRRLSRAKGPRNVTILMAHKVLSLAAVALLVLTAVRVGEVSRLGGWDWATVIVAGASFAAAMATGGMMSARESVSRRLRFAHRVTSGLAVIATAGSLYLLLVQM